MQNHLQASDDMHLMVVYFGQLRIMAMILATVFVIAGAIGAMYYCYLQKRRLQNEKMYASMYGVCPNYR